MTDVVTLQAGITYGPVESRRLGRSLGINLSPDDRKVCAFDCVYCQYGPSVAQPVVYDADSVPGVDAVVDAVRSAIEDLKGDPDYLTFSGNGEPTSHPEFPAIVDRVAAVAEERSLEVALFTNGVRLQEEAVREAFERVDAPFVKLDVGTPAAFRRVNRPAGIEFESLLSTLESMDSVRIQAMKFEGEVSNLGDVDAWIQAVERVDPLSVELYTVARPTALELEAADRDRLAAIAERLEHRGISTAVYV